MPMQNILFYYFQEQDNLEELREQLFNKCQELELLGKILIAKEGINGCVTGEVENTQQLIEHLKKIYTAIEFKITETTKHDFHKLFVRIRPEIITFNQEVKMDKKGQYIEPQDLKKELDSGKEIVMIDGRNNYESKIGKFKGAIAPDVDIFSNFPAAIKELEQFKDKSIVTYCTGGIRCEKLSAYMREQGFKDVRQLHGGIIRYGQEVGNAHWEGSCFVFDDRLAIPIAEPQEPITECEWCSVKCDSYHHCMLPSCDRRFIGCEQCVKEHESHCSKTCYESNIKTKHDTQRTVDSTHS